MFFVKRQSFLKWKWTYHQQISVGLEVNQAAHFVAVPGSLPTHSISACEDIITLEQFVVSVQERRIMKYDLLTTRVFVSAKTLYLPHTFPDGHTKPMARPTAFLHWTIHARVTCEIRPFCKIELRRCCTDTANYNSIDLCFKAPYIISPGHWANIITQSFSAPWRYKAYICGSSSWFYRASLPSQVTIYTDWVRRSQCGKGVLLKDTNAIVADLSPDSDDSTRTQVQCTKPIDHGTTWKE